MSDYRVEGDVHNGLGTLEEAAGRGLGNSDLEREGQADQVRGKMEKTLGKVEGVVSKAFGEPAARRVRESAQSAVEKAEDVYDRTRSSLDQRLSDEPYKVLGIAVGAGVLLGLLMARRSHTIIYQPRSH